MIQPVEHAALECERCGTVLETCRCLRDHEPKAVSHCTLCVRMNDFDVALERNAARRK